MKTHISLPFPPSINHYYRHTARGVSILPAGRKFRVEVNAHVVAQRAAKGYAGRLVVLINAYPPDNRRRDVDNPIKPLLDAMTHAGVWVDDSQIHDLRIVWGEQVEGGAVLVTINPMGAGQ
jgi:crossover junction endodeoxyribonuclease RusA